MNISRLPIEVSARHVHLSDDDLNTLFGKNYKLNVYKQLSQGGEFAAQECVDIAGKKNKIKNVRIIGPVREYTQVEISKTDGYRIGINPPLRVSGAIEDTPGIKIIGPRGDIDACKGLIVAKRHIHMNPAEAEKFNVEDKQLVSVKVRGERGLIFQQVIVRIKENFNLSFQIDTDEGNAADVNDGDTGELVI